MAARKKEVSFGGSSFESLSPDRPEGRPKILNVKLGLEQMLLLREALTAAIQEANGLDRTTKEGRDALYILAVHHDAKKVGVVRHSTRSPRRVTR